MQPKQSMTEWLRELMVNRGIVNWEYADMTCSKFMDLPDDPMTIYIASSMLLEFEGGRLELGSILPIINALLTGAAFPAPELLQ